MIRVIFNDGIMERSPLEVQEHLPAGDKLNSELWRRINEEAMRLAAGEAETGIVEVGICRVKDEDDPWYRDGTLCTPYGERICAGLAHQRMFGVEVCWEPLGQMRSWWTYRIAGGLYHD